MGRLSSRKIAIKVLFLDDDQLRHDAFVSAWSHESVIHKVYDAKSAIEQLQSIKFDIIFLDHDLGGEQLVTKTENTGYEVALWIEENLKNSPWIIIHSINRSGADRMKLALRNFKTVCQPFNAEKLNDLFNIS